MSFSQWKPQEPSIEGQVFHKDQHVLFRYRKKQVIGTNIKLLDNSAVVTLSTAAVTDTSEKTVISYKKLLSI
ncbi:hypothetical protein SAMN04487887_11626 [Enterococcus casseliflavus]|uniref:hypothetical protein n=1 Tax=Enterococcus casseliflavus TaxID=37734 RepID=UPI0008E80E75|nr:hypothetical protein [Enterococcus casseliflavus]SFE55643.1 hypothetical protein SAMN04487887_11626 [Enterococcus casseliflavus]